MITDAAPPPGERQLEPRVEHPAVVSSGVRRVARNSLAPFAATFTGRLLTWALAMVMARTLGPEGTGAYALAVNLWLYASIVADFGLGTWLTREVARDPAAARRHVRTTLGLRLLLSAAALPVLAGAGALWMLAGAADWRFVATVALLGLGLVPGAVSAAGTALFNAHERMTFPAAVQVAGAALTAVLGGALLLLGNGIVALALVSLVVNVLTAATFAVAARRSFFALSATLDWPKQWRLLSDAMPLMLNNLLNNVFFRVDVQVLQSRGSAVVGYYANAYKIVDAAGAVPSSFVLAIFPLLSRRAAAQGADRDERGGGLGQVYRLALKLLVAVALPIALVCSFTAHDLTLWLWGPEFLPDSAIALQILIWFLPLSFFNGLTQYVLIAAGLQRRITVSFAIAAAFNLTANLILIPRYSYVAAAAVTIASEIVLLVPFLAAVRARVPLPPITLAALRPLPAGCTMALALWLLLPWSLPAALLASSALYAAVLFGPGVLGAFDTDERRVLWSLLPRRFQVTVERRRSTAVSPLPLGTTPPSSAPPPARKTARQRPGRRR
ncbi:MAG: flippase [Chloroflexi bacterium]|nr:flippase [Chloroflexota bacterium]